MAETIAPAPFPAKQVAAGEAWENRPRRGWIWALMGLAAIVGIAVAAVSMVLSGSQPPTTAPELPASESPLAQPSGTVSPSLEPVEPSAIEPTASPTEPLPSPSPTESLSPNSPELSPSFPQDTLNVPTDIEVPPPIDNSPPRSNNGNSNGNGRNNKPRRTLPNDLRREQEAEQRRNGG
jgi:hypothetical protein